MRSKKEKIYFFFTMCVILVIGLIGRYFIKNYIIKANIEGSSMSPTYEDGEEVLVVKGISPSRNSVIVLKDTQNGKIIIKRCVAKPGDKVIIKNSIVYVNNKPIKDNYSKGKTRSGILIEEITLGDGEYIVLGDNRENSLDSRVLGVIKEEDIVGVVLGL